MEHFWARLIRSLCHFFSFTIGFQFISDSLFFFLEENEHFQEVCVTKNVKMIWNRSVDNQLIHSQIWKMINRQLFWWLMNHFRHFSSKLSDIWQFQLLFLNVRIWTGGRTKQFVDLTLFSRKFRDASSQFLAFHRPEKITVRSSRLIIDDKKLLAAALIQISVSLVLSVVCVSSSSLLPVLMTDLSSFVSAVLRHLRNLLEGFIQGLDRLFKYPVK